MENESGALSRVVALFSARGYNIESLTVAPTEDPSLSRLTLVTHGSEQIIEQITKQLNKLIEVVKLADLTDGSHIEREMMLVKVRVISDKREFILHIVDIFRGRVIDVNRSVFTIELTGTSDKLDSFLENLSEAKIIEVVRSGVMGIARGEKSLSL